MIKVPRTLAVASLVAFGAFAAGRFTASNSSSPDGEIIGRDPTNPVPDQVQNPESTSMRHDANDAPREKAESRSTDKDRTVTEPSEVPAAQDETVSASGAAQIDSLTRDRINAISYDVVANTAIAKVAYLENIACDATACDLAFTFFSTANISSNTADLMQEMNSRFAAHSATNDVQIYLRSIEPGLNGIGEVRLVTGPRKPRTLGGRIFVVDDPNGEN